MDFHLLLRNRHVARVVVGIPDGHEHIRARIESDGGDVITLQEATLAALVRAYLSVSTHPQRKAVELRSMAVEESKEGFAMHQLMEVPSEESALRGELAAVPAEASDTAPPPMPPPTNHGVPPSGDLPTQHGKAEDEEDDLELDDLEEDGDGPVFGDVPTHHSKPEGA
jgi:hypothetical protein